MVLTMSSESEILDKGYGASGGVKSFAKFFEKSTNDSMRRRYGTITHASHSSIFVANFAKNNPSTGTLPFI